MSLEAIKQVTQAEQANQARKIEAQAQAKRLVAEAERRAGPGWSRRAPRRRSRPAPS